MSARILIIEDEKLIRWSLRQKFEGEGFLVDEAETGAEGVKAAEHRIYDLIMLDYKLPDQTGVDVLSRIRESDRDVIVIMMTAYSSVQSAVDAMKLGAYDYVTKPFDIEQLLHTVRKSLETVSLRREVRELRNRLKREFGFDRFVGKHPAMERLFRTLTDVAASPASTVFLRGETGTGKDLAARMVHYNSARAGKPFMNITCTALSESLLESELFGHEKGAFTDARSQKKGLFELADGGTVFLDEVGDLPMPLQGKLLRFLEERTFRRVGGTEEVHVDVRIISATNRDLDAAVEANQFRRDLLYRLDVVPVYLPTLRERGDDVRLLAQYFVETFAKEFKKPCFPIEEAAYRKLQSHSWPGNVRELRNVCERATLLAKGESLTPEDFVLGAVTNGAHHNGDGPLISLPSDGIDLFELEGELMRAALERTDNNQTRAAKLLKLTRDTFRYRLEKHGML